MSAPFLQRAVASGRMALLLRTASDPGAMTDAARRQVLNIDSGQPVYDIQTLRELTDVALGPARLALVTLGTFAGIPLLIPSLVLFAPFPPSFPQRTRQTTYLISTRP